MDHFMILPNDLHGSDHFPAVVDFAIARKKNEKVSEKIEKEDKKEEHSDKVKKKKEDTGKTDQKLRNDNSEQDKQTEEKSGEGKGGQKKEEKHPDHSGQLKKGTPYLTKRTKT